MVDLYVEFWAFTQNISRHQYQTPHIKVHVTFFSMSYKNVNFMFLVREFDTTILQPTQ